MSEDYEEQTFFAIGLLLTAAWGLIGVVILAADPVQGLPELGNFLAGWCAPAVVAWLIGAFVLQRRELKEARRAFDQQVKETKKLVEATAEHTEYLRTRERPVVVVQGLRMLSDILVMVQNQGGRDAHALRVLLEFKGRAEEIGEAVDVLEVDVLRPNQRHQVFHTIPSELWEGVESAVLEVNRPRFLGHGFSLCRLA